MLWIQGLHVVFVVTWFAGLFYLPRIFVYYAQAEDDTTKTTLAIMARKLYRFVTPLMMLAVALGLWRLSLRARLLLEQPLDAVEATGSCVSSLSITSNAVATLARINGGDNSKSHVFYRFFNEVPVLFLFAIVLLVYIRPG